MNRVHQLLRYKIVTIPSICFIIFIDHLLSADWESGG